MPRGKYLYRQIVGRMEKNVYFCDKNKRVRQYDTINDGLRKGGRGL